MPHAFQSSRECDGGTLELAYKWQVKQFIAWFQLCFVTKMNFGDKLFDDKSFAWSTLQALSYITMVTIKVVISPFFMLRSAVSRTKGGDDGPHRSLIDCGVNKHIAQENTSSLFEPLLIHTRLSTASFTFTEVGLKFSLTLWKLKYHCNFVTILREYKNLFN